MKLYHFSSEDRSIDFVILLNDDDNPYDYCKDLETCIVWVYCWPLNLFTWFQPGIRYCRQS